MANNLRPSGIEVLGDVPWGTHFCQFYETKEDLLSMVVPYFKAGLEHNEHCLWVLTQPLTIADAQRALREAIPELDTFVSQGKIEIAAHDIRVFHSAQFDLEEAENPWQLILQTWRSKLAEALEKGFDGLRICANGSGFEQTNWQGYLQYEEALDHIVNNKPMLALCAYSLEHANAVSLLDYAQFHDAVVARRMGQWKVLESSRTLELKAQLKRTNEELEERVAQRTAELQAALEEQKREVATRRQAEELANQIVATFPGTFVLFDKEYRILRWNPQLESGTGYTGEEIKKLHGLNDMISPDNRGRIDEMVQQAFTKGWASSEVTTLGKDGTTRLLYFNARCTHYEGRPCVIACGVDISKRRTAETMLRNLVEQSVLGVYVIEDGKFTYVNPGLAEIFGYGQEELIARLEVLRLIHPDDRAFVAEQIRVRVTGEKKSVHYQARALKKDGTERWIEVYCKGCLNDNPGAIMGMVLDVTERKKAEEDRQLAYRRLTYHMENTPLAVIEWNRDQHIVRWSKRAEEIFGWTAAEVMGTPTYTRPRVFEDDLAVVERSTAELLSGQADSNMCENRNYTKDGRVIYCKWYNSVLRDEEGNVQAHLSLVQDISVRKNAEAALQQSYEEIRRLTQHLQDIREEERTHIAREIHDELGQQLTVLKMDVSWLNKKLAEADPAVKDKLKDLLDLLDGTVQSVRRISAELRPSLLDDLGLVVALEWHLKEFEKRSGIRAWFTAKPREPNLPKEVKTGLYRIFQESLTNVARHSGATELRVRLVRTDGSLVLSMDDNGRGFDKEKLGQAKTLGVLGMRERAAMMQGRYEIHSAPGKGTSAKVTIPLGHRTNGKVGKTPNENGPNPEKKA